MTHQPNASHPLHYLPKDAAALLDVGCNSGDALRHARELGIRQLYGIEINPHAVEIARERLKGFVDCQIFNVSADSIPIADSAVDVAICSEVLEHIPEEMRQAAVREIHRVLKPGGRFIVTVPASGVFAFLDPANARLLFPNLFQVVARIAGGAGREKGYENQKHGIVWHHHFSRTELDGILTPLFEIEQVRYRGSLFAPICNWLEFPFYRRRAYEHPVLKAIQSVAAWEMSKNFGELLGYNVLLVARKKS